MASAISELSRPSASARIKISLMVSCSPSICLVDASRDGSVNITIEAHIIPARIHNVIGDIGDPGLAQRFAVAIVGQLVVCQPADGLCFDLRDGLVIESRAKRAGVRTHPRRQYRFDLGPPGSRQTRSPPGRQLRCGHLPRPVRPPHCANARTKHNPSPPALGPLSTVKRWVSRSPRS